VITNGEASPNMKTFSSWRKRFRIFSLANERLKSLHGLARTYKRFEPLIKNLKIY
jgi:hypothetical protein